MTPEEIAADRAVIDAATDGEWVVVIHVHERVVWSEADECPVARVPYDADADTDVHNAAFIAAARTGWPRALDALEAAWAHAEAMQETWRGAVEVTRERDSLRTEVARLRGAMESAQEDRRRAVANLTRERDEARAEVGRLRPACSCTHYMAGGDGPEEDCPQHGRTYGAWVARSDKAEAAIARVRALPCRDHYTVDGCHSGECVDDDALRADLDALEAALLSRDAWFSDAKEWQRRADEARAEVERLRASLALQAESVENAAAEVARRCEGGSMTADPRVEAVAEALAAEFAENEGVTAVEATSVALAALDAYDKEHPRVVWSEYEALIKDTVEADLRERIVRDLDHAWTVKSDAAGRHHDSYQEGYLDGIEHAASIVSRGTDPGEAE